jgi:hypothetical protein
MSIQQPVVVDLGKKKSKQVKKVLKGQGPLYQHTLDAVEQVRASLGPDAANREFVPVIVIYKKKPKKKKKNRLGIPMPF